MGRNRQQIALRKHVRDGILSMLAVKPLTALQMHTCFVHDARNQAECPILFVVQTECNKLVNEGRIVRVENVGPRGGYGYKLAD